MGWKRDGIPGQSLVRTINLFASLYSSHRNFKLKSRHFFVTTKLLWLLHSVLGKFTFVRAKFVYKQWDLKWSFLFVLKCGL